MAINTSNNKVRIISTTVSGLSTNSKFSDIKSPALVVNTSEGGIFYADGSGGTSLKQLAALPNHSHSDYATTSQLADYLPKSGGTLGGTLEISPNNDNPLTLTSNKKDADGATRIKFIDNERVFQGYVMTGWGNLILSHRSQNVIGVGDDGIWCSSDNSNTKNAILHANNYYNYALPKTGGTLEGPLRYGKHLAMPNAQYNTTNDAVGCIKIKIPTNPGNTMLSFWIDVFNYSNGSSYSAYISGYIFSDNNWYQPTTFLIGNTSKIVRYGHDGTNYIICIGLPTDTYSYPNIIIRDVLLGHQPVTSSFNNKWNISITSDISDIKFNGSNECLVLNTTNYTTYCASVGHSHSDYLPKSGGTITSTEQGIATLMLNSIDNSGHSILQFANKGTYLGALGFSAVDTPYFRTSGGVVRNLIHSGNIGSQSVASATNASNIYINNSTSSGAFPITFVSNTDKGSKTLFVSTGKALTFNPSTGNLTATTFTGNLTGNVSGNAATATNADMLDNVHIKDIPYARISSGGLGTSEESGNADTLPRTMFFRDNGINAIGYNVYHSQADTYGMQLVTGYTDSDYRIRTKVNGEWKQWRKLATTEDTVAAATRSDSLYITGVGYSTSWNWSGKSGTPDWVWGGTDGTNMYVYKPANFSVNYATTAGTSNEAVRLLSPYTYENNTSISTTTTPETLFPHSYTFSAMMQSDSSLFGVNNYANVLNFSGYKHYGATQFAVHYNSGNRAAIRTYIQTTSTWTPWKFLAFKDDLSSYIPTSEKVNAAAVSHTGYGTNGTYVPTMNFLSYWNGAYNSGNTSNLTYCKHGAFGTIVTKNTGDYAEASHSHAGYSVPATYATTLGQSGYYLITINSTINWMLAFRVRVYKSYVYQDIRFSGYNYGNSYWYSPTAKIVDGDGDATVYFGYTSANNLWVAIPAGNYTGIQISDVVNGYYQTDKKAKDLFTITNVTALPGTTSHTFDLKAPDNRFAPATHSHSGYATTSSLASYLPLSGGSLSGYLSSSDYILGTGLIRVNASGSTSNFGYIKAETYDSNRSVVHIGSNYGGSSSISNSVSYDAIGIYRTCVGIGGTFAGSTLKANYDEGIKLDINGSARGTNFITTSDKRLKKNINEISSDKLSNALNVNFYEFDYVNNDNHSAGHIAQEVKDVLPEFVHGNESETEHLSIDYTGLHSIQIKALIDEINKLKEEIRNLKSSNIKLK